MRIFEVNGVDIMKTIEEAKNICRTIWHLYLEQRDYKTLATFVDQEMTLIGTGAHEICHTSAECFQKLYQEEEQWDGSFLITREWYQGYACDAHTFNIIGELHTKENVKNRIIYEVTTRFTMLLHYKNEQWKVLHVHQSVGDHNQMDNEFFPKHIVDQSNRMLKERIAQKTKELEERNQQVLYYSQYDYLTDIWNRQYCEKQIEQTMAKHAYGTMLMIDVDHFKWFNDSYGHPFGDKVLKTLAYCMKTVFSQGLCGRIGGDEFVVYGTNCEGDITCVEDKINSFFTYWKQAQKALDIAQTITLSVGVAYYPIHGTNFDKVWQNADKAMYEAKKHSDNTICFYDTKH